MIDGHPGCDEQVAVEKLSRGEPMAVAALVERYGSSVYRIAQGALGDPREAEEVTREVLAGVLRQPGPYALARRVYRVAAVVIQQRLRSRRASAQAEPDLPTPAFDALGRHAHPLLDWSSCLDDAATADAVGDAVGPAVRGLPPTSRVALLLRDAEGVTEAETAAALGLTRDEARSHIHRARLYVRAELAQLFS